MIGSMCERWFIAITRPPVAGTFSASTHSRFVVASNSGLRMPMATVNAVPRG